MSQQKASSTNTSNLSSAKRALLEKRMGGKLSVQKADGIPSYEKLDPIPLSFAQERLWFLNQLEPNSPAYNMYNVVSLTGMLNADLLEASLRKLIERHDILRTNFVVADGQPYQQIASESDFKMGRVDAQPTVQPGISPQLEQRIISEISHPFDLSQGPLIRALLIQQAQDEHILVLTIHHIIFDEWSHEIFWKEISAIYRTLLASESLNLPEMTVQYSDFSIWQKKQADLLMEKQLDYWLNQLSGELPYIQLPVDHSRPINQTFRGGTIWREAPPGTYERLIALNQDLGTTMFMSLLAAYQLLLSRLTGQEEILVGSPIANRTRRETQGLIGFFLNTLVFRADLTADISFAEFAAFTRTKALEAFAHQDLPFEKLVDKLHPNRDVSHNPIFQVMFVHQKSAAGEIDLPGLEAKEIPLDIGVAKFDLTLFAQESEGVLSIGFEYNNDIFELQTVERFLDYYLTLVDSILADPQQKISEIQILPLEERNKILWEWNDTAAGPIPEVCIHQLIEQQCKQNPGALAVVEENGELTYGELNQRSNQLAHYLQRSGIGPDIPVALLLDRSIAMVVSILAVLKAGGTYLPLDPAYPRQRLMYMLSDAKAPLVITQQAFTEGLSDLTVDIIDYDRDWPQISQEENRNPVSQSTPENLAYIIYTSGSTGQPRGVPVSHHNLVHSTLARYHFYEKSPTAFLLLSSFTFDSSIAGLFWTLCSGGKLVLPPLRIEQDISRLAAIIAEQSISHTLCLPSLYSLLLELAAPEQLGNLDTVMVAGEACLPDLVQLHHDVLPATKLFNEYGPTETTVWSTAYPLKPDFDRKRVPIGRPIPNAKNFILDRYYRPVPIGVAGELCISGPGVTRGYLNDEVRTKEKFIEVSFDGEPSNRLYRTGDRARHLPDGNIEFLDRFDQQVKIRGNRVELEEIEGILRSMPGIKDAVVKFKDQHLAAYLIAERGEAPASDWRGYLSDYLADYMIPASFTMLKAFPHTPNGKIDRNALPDPQPVALEDAYVAPRTSTEKQLADIWIEVLGIESPGVYDNFFDVGGNSLLSIRVFSRIADIFEVKLPLAVLFTETTLERLASRIDKEKDSSQNWSLIVPIQPKGERIPFFCIHGLTGDVLWFRQLGELLAPDQPFYGIQAQGLDGETPAIDNIYEMAGRYIQELKIIQPAGPYILGGASLGGTVALEMAQQLEEKGEQVSLLVMFDHAPDVLENGSLPRRTVFNKISHLLSNSYQWARSMQALGGNQIKQRIMRKIRVGWKKIGGSSKQRSHNGVDAADLLDYGSELPEFRQHMVGAHWHAINNYRAKEYNKPLLLLQAKSQPLLSTERPVDTWVYLANGKFSVIDIPGSHEGIFHEPHVHELASALVSQLAQYQEAG